MGSQANCQYLWVDGGPCFAGDADNDLDEPCDNMFFLTELLPFHKLCCDVHVSGGVE